MSGAWARLLLALYYLILWVLAVYGAHRLVLVVASRRGRPAPPPPDPPAQWPLVTVQLPLYNEMYVVSRLLEAVAALDYPPDRLQIQVLDDSTDETTAIAADLVARHRARGLDVELLHRADRRGYKAGALAAGLERTRGELIAIFDADFVPPPDFLRRTVPYFADPGIGMVQGRWDHLNREASMLTRAQALLLDGHFVIEHAGRFRAGCFFNFNGTAGIWRRRAIESAGGWEHDTLTEDLDLSYRAQLAGWRFLYLPDLLVPAELPPDVAAFKSQQRRWARGSIQTGRKLLGRVLRAPLPLRVKLEAAVHLTNNLSYPLGVALSLLIFPAMLVRRELGARQILAIDLPLFAAGTLSLVVFYLASQAGAGRPWWRELGRLPFLVALGIGLAVTNSRAVLVGLGRRGGVFERTPKYGGAGPTGDRGRRYRPVRDPGLVVEGALAAYFAACLALAVVWRMWVSLPFLYLFLQGYAYMFLLTALPAWRERRALAT
jgi:cellulose synthase/poly-beta-1,6-N-acetylglucosamine synthase-like glycosyltransferase